MTPSIDTPYLRSGKTKEEIVFGRLAVYLRSCFTKNNNYGLKERQFNQLINYIIIYDDIIMVHDEIRKTILNKVSNASKKYENIDSDRMKKYEF